MNNTTLEYGVLLFLKILAEKSGVGGHHTKYHCFIQHFLDQKTVKHWSLFKVFKKAPKRSYCSKTYISLKLWFFKILISVPGGVLQANLCKVSKWPVLDHENGVTPDYGTGLTVPPVLRQARSEMSAASTPRWPDSRPAGTWAWGGGGWRARTPQTWSTPSGGPGSHCGPRAAGPPASRGRSPDRNSLRFFTASREMENPST